MASEIRVNKIENRSGLGTVTFADTGVDLAGIVTATTFSGSGASLTNVPDSALSAVTASKLSGALPAISAANLTNVPAANVVGVHTSLTVTNATTTGTAVVGGGVTISESGIEASGIGITVANINGTQIGGRRNKIYNGAMQISQRNNTSSTNIEGNTTKYHLDRFSIQGNNLDELSAGVAQDTDAPDGFAYSLKVTVNTPESAIASDEFVSLYQKMEGQDFQDLAYNKSSPKDITMSFYVKSSITGTFGFTVYRDEPGTDRIVNKFYTINSANTWERKVITIAGDTGKGIQNTTGAVWWNCWHLAAGSNYTSSVSGVWQNYVTTNWAGQESGSAPTNDVITTNGATWAVTGIQLETGSQATDFEHRSYAEELRLCQRYFQFIGAGFVTAARGASSSVYLYSYTCPVNLRASPTVSTSDDIATGTFSVRRYRDDAGTSDSTSTPTTNSSYFELNNNTVHLQQDGFSAVDDRSATIFVGGGAITLSSEL